MSVPKRVTASVFCFCLVVFGARHGATQSSAAGRQQAGARLSEGLELAKREQWDEARLHFQQAYALLPTVDLLWNLAIAELNSNHPLEALRHFREYASHRRADGSKMVALDKLIQRASERLGRIRVQAAKEASILLDGAAPHPASWNGDILDVIPGEHVLSAKRDAGHEEARVTVAAGATVTVRLLWKPSDPAPTSRPSAIEPTALPEPTLPVPDALSPIPTKTWVLLGLGAGAVASTAVAAGYGFAANRNRQRADEFEAILPASCNASSACTDWRDVVATQQHEARIATALFVSGGILAAAAIGTLVFWPSSEPRHAARATLAFVPAAGGGTVHVSANY
jgi:hypothetical protein